jgi:predicted nucleic acid-binding protein
MTLWVIDAGVLLATVLDENLTKLGDALFARVDQENITLAAPVLFQYEIVATIRKHVYQGNLTAEEGQQSLDTVLKRSVQFYLNEALLRRAYELATQLNRPTAYDAQYLAVGEHVGCDAFWTTDKRLFNAVSQHLPWVNWLGNFTPPSNPT